MKGPNGERLGDPLEPPTDPGKPEGGNGRGIAVLAVVVCVIVVGGIVLAEIPDEQMELGGR